MNPNSLIYDSSGNWVPNRGFTYGGQVNQSAYDLWSYGPDHLTCVPNINVNWMWADWQNPLWTNTTSALDDITNWRH